MSGIFRRSVRRRMRLANMFVKLILQRALTLRQFRAVSGELRLENARRTGHALRLNRNGSEPTCDTEKRTRHWRTRPQDTPSQLRAMNLHFNCAQFPGRNSPRAPVRFSAADFSFFQFFRAFPQEVPIIHSFCTKRRGFSVAMKSTIKHSACRHSEMFLRVLPGIAAEPAVPEDSRG